MNSRKFAFIGVWIACLIVLGVTAFGLPYSDGNLANVDDSNQKSEVKIVDNLNQIWTYITNSASHAFHVIIDSGTVTISNPSFTQLGNASVYIAPATTVVRANATNVTVYAASTNWAHRDIVNPFTVAHYGNYSTNTPSAGAADFYIPPSVATNTYDSQFQVPDVYQGVITMDTTGFYGAGIQRP